MLSSNVSEPGSSRPPWHWELIGNRHGMYSWLNKEEHAGLNQQKCEFCHEIWISPWIQAVWHNQPWGFSPIIVWCVVHWQNQGTHRDYFLKYHSKCFFMVSHGFAEISRYCFQSNLPRSGWSAKPWVAWIAVPLIALICSNPCVSGERLLLSKTLNPKKP